MTSYSICFSLLSRHVDVKGMSEASKSREKNSSSCKYTVMRKNKAHSGNYSRWVELENKLLEIGSNC